MAEAVGEKVKNLNAEMQMVKVGKLLDGAGILLTTYGVLRQEVGGITYTHPTEDLSVSSGKKEKDEKQFAQWANITKWSQSFLDSHTIDAEKMEPLSHILMLVTAMRGEDKKLAKREFQQIIRKTPAIIRGLDHQSLESNQTMGALLVKNLNTYFTELTQG